MSWVQRIGLLRGAPSRTRSRTKVVDEEEHGTFVLDARWAQAMAGLADAMDVARRFLAEGDPGAEDDASQVETFTGLVEGVVRVCRAAHSRGLGLVYGWTL